MTYDDVGNRQSQTVDGITTSYTYDAQGIRQSTTDNGVTTQYLTDPNRSYAQVIEESDALGNLSVAYTYGDDLVSQHRGTASHTYHYDGLGSTRALSDATGTVTDSYRYTAFGEDDGSVGTTDNAYRYTGEQYDANVGFYYLRARYYNASLGRFHSMDTYAGRMHEPATLHKYLYVHANPVNNIDPSGNIASLGGLAAGLRISAQSALRTVSVGLGKAIGRAVGATYIAGRIAGARLKREVARCRASRGKKCRIPNLVVIGGNHNEASMHIADTIKGKGSNGLPVSPLLTYKSAGRSRKGKQWYVNKPECKGNVTRVSGKDCDEWPFFTTSGGGKRGYARKQVSLRLISSQDNQRSGGVWGRAVAKGKNGDKYTVVPMGPVSFFFSNGEFGF